MVSRTDALRWQMDGSGQEVTLGETIASASQPVAFPDTPSGAIADLIVETGIGRVPIIDPVDKRVLGILSRQDLLKARSAHRQLETNRSRFSSATTTSP
jgi:CBS domain-containing protein